MRLSVWSKLQTICYVPDDDTATQSTLASLKPKMVYPVPYWNQLTWVVLKNRSLSTVHVVVVGIFKNIFIVNHSLTISSSK